MITPDQILALQPCFEWTRERITDLIGDGVEPNKLAEILIKSVEPDDARWLIARLLSRTDRITWATDCAERVLPIYEQRYPDDIRPRKAIEAARQDSITTTAAYAIHDAAYVTAAADAAYAAADTAYVGAVNAASAYTVVDAAANAAYAAYAAVDAADAAVDAAANAAYATYTTASAAAADEYAWQIQRACRLLMEPQ